MFKSWPVAGPAMLAILFAGNIHAGSLTPLTLAEAERIAIERDAERDRLLEESAAQRDDAAVATTLPDPEFRLGAANLPVDTFALDQEAMTQIVLGVRQSFPPGDTLELQGERGEWLAEGRERLAGDRERYLRYVLRQLWLERQAADETLEYIRATAAAVQPLLESSAMRYSTGGGEQADYFSAQLKLDRLQERELRAREQRSAVEAALSRYLGDAARSEYQPVQLVMPGTPGELQQQLEHHPRVQAQDAEITAGEAGEGVAREQFGARWALDFSYGQRRGLDPMGGDRPDFASAMVSVSVPLFNRDVKRRSINAAERRTRAATYSRINLLRELESRLAETLSRHADVSRQIALFEERLLPVARRSVESSETAYANDRISLDRYVETQLDLLDLEVQRIERNKRRDQLRAELDYLGGPAQ